jgi:hypothetical protein
MNPGALPQASDECCAFGAERIRRLVLMTPGRRVEKGSYLKKTLKVERMVFGVEYFFFTLRARSAIAGRNARLRVSFSDQACL